MTDETFISIGNSIVKEEEKAVASMENCVARIKRSGTTPEEEVENLKLREKSRWWQDLLGWP